MPVRVRMKLLRVADGMLIGLAEMTKNHSSLHFGTISGEVADPRFCEIPGCVRYFCIHSQVFALGGDGVS